jgi:hypothetical protein
MRNKSIKVVRPWPADQPRPPIVHRPGCTCVAMPKPADTRRQRPTTPTTA